MKYPFYLIFGFMLVLFVFSCNRSKDEKQLSQEEAKNSKDNVMVVISTNYGDITVELFPEKAPLTVENFLSYVREGFYENTIFHRVIPGFVIQGGGLTLDMKPKPTKPPIKNEADNGLKNERGTIAMARTSEVDSAMSQFYINLSDNTFLDHNEKNFGYAVFGKVVKGMDVVEKIASVKTHTKGFYQNVPVEPVIINKITIVKGKVRE